MSVDADRFRRKSDIDFDAFIARRTGSLSTARVEATSLTAYILKVNSRSNDFLAISKGDENTLPLLITQIETLEQGVRRSMR